MYIRRLTILISTLHIHRHCQIRLLENSREALFGAPSKLEALHESEYYPFLTYTFTNLSHTFIHTI